ncbi:MAG: MBL fold metallo-hydrolase [Erysipelotrichaceae bacterium]|nr:MBL fold metallo-hydrolase [Erysipelotrichaceae bacterium]
MKFKKVLYIFPLIGLLSSCVFKMGSSSSTSIGSNSSIDISSEINSSNSDVSSSETSGGTSLSSENSSSEETTSSQTTTSSSETNNVFNDRIESMVSTSVIPTDKDANEAENKSYNSSAILGTAEHPILNQTTSDYLEVIVFEQPVQYGDALLIKAGNAEIIVDFGNYSSSRFDDGTYYGNYLTSQYNSYITDKKVDLMIMSHAHSDHLGGVEGFTRSEVSQIGMLVDYGYRYVSDSTYYSTVRSVISSKYNGVYHPVFDHVNEINNAFKRTYVTQELFIDWIDTGMYQSNPELQADDLTYNGETISDLNITSVVGILNYRNFSMLLTGDMQNTTSYGDIAGENIMVSKNSTNDLFHHTTMLKVGHHGSSSGTSNNLLDAVTPSLAVISAGRVDISNSYNGKYGACSGHPHLATLNRLGNKGVKTYLNSASGTLHFVSDGSLTNPVYFSGSPLKSTLKGGNGVNDSLNEPYGDTTDELKDLFSSNFYKMCHA